MYRAASGARLRQCISNPLPALDLRALARRAALPAALAVVAVTVFTLAGGPLQAFADAFNRAIEADPRWVAAALVFELLSFAGYVALLWLVGGAPRGGWDCARAPRSPRPHRGHAPAPHRRRGRRCPHDLGLPARGPRHARAPARCSPSSSCSIPSSSPRSPWPAGCSRSGSPRARPARADRVPALGATLVIAAALALALRAPAGRSGPTAAVSQAVRDAIALVRSRDPRLLGAIGWWAFDAAVLWSLLQARLAAAAHRPGLRLLRRPGGQHHPRARSGQRRDGGGAAGLRPGG